MFFRREYDTDELALNFSHEMVIAATRIKYINGLPVENNYFTGVIPHSVISESETNAFISFCELLRLKGRVAEISFRKLPHGIFDSLREGSELLLPVSSAIEEIIKRQQKSAQNSCGARRNCNRKETRRFILRLSGRTI